MSTVTLLWTGGWDSTFRLIQLLYKTGVCIQPLYLVDEERNSMPHELDVMRGIRRGLQDMFPEEADRLLPTNYGSYRGTRIESHHKKAWEVLKERGRVGLQYPVLASYAEQNNIDRMELSIEATTGSAAILASMVELHETPAGPVYVLPEKVQGPEAMYRRFAFPLLDHTKLDMKAEAERMGMLDIMKQTWFCYNPTLGLPCGSCQPCIIAMAEGMGYRVGYIGPFLFSFRDPRARIKGLLRRFGLESSVKSLINQYT